MWSALGRLVGVKATPTDVEPPPPPAASEGRTGFPNPEARTVVLVPVATTPAAHGGKRPAQQTGTSLAAATTPHYASAAAEREAKRLRPGPFQLVEPGFVSGGNPGGAQGWRAVSSGTVATTLVLKGGGRDAKSCATQPSKPALASPFALVPTAFSALLAVAHDEFPAATVTGDRWAWWVPPGVTHEELLRCYTWELAQAFKHTLVQRFSYQYSADLPQYIFSRNYADVLTSEQLVDAARHFRPPVQQRLGLYTDLFGELLQEVSAIVMRQAGLVLADNVGLSELTELLSELCLRPPTVGSDGKLRILLPRDGEFKPKNAQVLETVNRWGLGTASRAWWVDELVAPNAPLPPMGTRLLYAVMLAEAHMTQGEAERILGHVTVDRTQPHTLELMIRMKPKLRTGSALCRTRNLGILTLPSDFLVSEFVDALADPDVADILRPKEDPRRSKSSPGSARTPFAASPARTGRAKATSSDPSGAGSGSEPEVEWLTLVLYNKSIEAQAQGLVYPQPDLGLARDTNFMAGEGWSAHGRTLDEIRVFIITVITIKKIKRDTGIYCSGDNLYHLL